MAYEVTNDLKTEKIEEVKNILINDLEKSGKLYSQERKFNSVKEGLKYLNSAGMLNIQEDKVSFFHQSIFDYFISELMIEKFEEGLEKTVRWYLDNEEWLREVTSGDYQQYYEKMYSNK